MVQAVSRQMLLGLPVFEPWSEHARFVVHDIPLEYFIFMLPCIVIDLFSNEQPGALIIHIFFCYKTLNVSGIFFAHHQEFSTVHSALVSGTAALSRLCLEADIKTCMKLTSAECTVENS
jgi:hypothetical protein